MTQPLSELERARYESALRRLGRNAITPSRLARVAHLEHAVASVRAALRADARYERVRYPSNGPERYALLGVYPREALGWEVRA